MVGVRETQTSNTFVHHKIHKTSAVAAEYQYFNNNILGQLTESETLFIKLVLLLLYVGNVIDNWRNK